MENFKSVELKSALLSINTMWLPYKPKMLLHIKGRSHVQVRLVEPSYHSINRGDCFLLVTPTNLFTYIGAFANIIEIAHCRKLAADVIESKDLGCKAPTNMELQDGKEINKLIWQQFWDILETPTNVAVAGPGNEEEDVQVELNLIKANRIYEFIDSSFRSLQQYWGLLPMYKMLDAKKVIIFDFGSEVYVWNGKNASIEEKRAAMRLTEEYYEQSLDYSTCALNPLNYAQELGARDEPHEKTTRLCRRGDWCLLGKITQNMETVLFKQKFADWPEVERTISETDLVAKQTTLAISRINAKELYEGSKYTEPNVILENTNLGRGHFYYDTETMRHFDVITKSTDKWQMDEFNYEAVRVSSDFAHFYTAQSYIIRWIYVISITVRELNSNVSKRSIVGRDRCVYYCWQGKDASANEKGAAALLSIELDKEKGTQMRISQGEESTAFIRLFKLMYVHQGSKKDCWERHHKNRLYQLLGNLAEESVMLEVQCDVTSLRSRASMILINGSKGLIYIWNGCKSASHTCELAKLAAERIAEEKSVHFFSDSNIRIVMENEGAECKKFIEIFPNIASRLYGSLLGETKEYNYEPRLFNFSSVKGTFTATEIENNIRTKDLVTVYPFHQSTLYNASQPTAFLVDDGDKLWLWLGWWPRNGIIVAGDDLSSLNSHNRAGESRWAFERREALQTVLAYWRAKFGDNVNEPFHGIKGYVVWAGLEPVEFKAIFPTWTDNDHVKDISLADKRNECETSLRTALAAPDTYPLNVLQKRPLPENIDPTKLEAYLDNNDFKKTFNMSKREFESISAWKQIALKKQHKLF